MGSLVGPLNACKSQAYNYQFWTIKDIKKSKSTKGPLAWIVEDAQH